MGEEQVKPEPIVVHAINAEYITPDTPLELRNAIVWDALKTAFEDADTKEQIWPMLTAWNMGNDPPVPEKELANKFVWALRKWDHKFKK